MATLLDELTPRGLIHDQTPGLKDRLAQGPLTGYVGFDPTADSLHVGHLLAVMSLAWLQRCGGTPIIVVGGGTGMVGDPSGKRTERPVLTVEEIDRNVAAIRGQLERFVSFEGANAARVRNNADWLRPLGLMEFLRDVGKHFTVNYMLAKDSVKGRMEAGISYTEFTYMLVQALDFWHLWKTERCELQMGGSDQWGNITAGTELISRREGASAHGLTFPLLTTAALMAQHAADPGKRPAQRRLAEEMTARVHGPDTAVSVVAASRVLFGGTDLRTAGAEVLRVLSGEIPATRGAASRGRASS